MEPYAHSGQSLRGLVQRIVERRRLLLGVWLGVFGLVAAWTLLATPRYKSTALLRIVTRSSTPIIPDALKEVAGASGLGALTRDELETDLGVLKSQRMLDATIDGLALTAMVAKPSDRRALVLRARVLDSTDVSGKLTFTRRDDGRYDLAAEKLEGVGALPAVVAPGDSLRAGSVLLALPENLRAGGPGTIVVRLLPHYQVRDRMKKRLTIRRQEGGSRLVEVSFEDPDRVLAAQVVDRLVREYVSYTWRTDEADDRGQISDLGGALASSRVRLAAAEEALRNFQQRQRLVVPEEQASQQVKRIGVIDAKLDAARIERNALAEMLVLIRSRAKGGADPTAFRQLATFPSLITNRAIQDLLQALIDLESRRSALLVTRTSENAEVQQLSSRIADIDAQLFRLGTQYLESLDQQLASTSRTAMSLTDTLVALPAAGMQYGRLAREREIMNEEYLALTKQVKIAEIQDLLRREKVKVVDSPHVANEDDPAYPKRLVQLVLGFVLAIVVAFTVGLAAVLWAESGAG